MLNKAPMTLRTEGPLVEENVRILPGKHHRAKATNIIARNCRSCGEPLEGETLDLGSLPSCNRFSTSRAVLPLHPLRLTGCGYCGLIQLDKPPAITMVRPRVPWIRYNEPVAHLDDLAAHLTASRTQTGPNPAAIKAFGFGPFEEPLLDRLARGGVETVAPDLLAESDDATTRATTSFPYLETWQARLDRSILSSIAANHGATDIISCRYLLEHCHKPLATLRAFRPLLKPDGVLVLEVPDSSKFLAANDYCFPWEEHVCYFVERSFVSIVERAGYELVSLRRYPGRLEDALVGIFRATRAAPHNRAKMLAEDLFTSYRANFPATRAFVRKRLTEFAGPARDGVALFGMGHQAIMFVNALGVGDLIGAVADDDPNKLGLLAPGLSAPIKPSADLFDNHRLKVCLLAVSPSSEPKVREKLAPLGKRGAQFHTIYAGADGSILDGRHL